MKQIDLNVGGMAFRAREHGSGEPLLLLHGFPETSRMWEPLMERLAGEGFHCVAPDQRGYSPGARLEGAVNYTYKHFAADIAGFMDAMGWERAHLIGHDWGAAAGWAAVGSFPERVMSWTPMSVPHITAFGKAIRENPEQQQKSQYINFFRQVGTAEDTFAANDYAAIRGLFSQTHDKDEVDEYIGVLSQDGALTGALNWYRGSEGIRPDQGDGNKWPPCSTPTLLIWGKNDMAIGRAAVEAGASYMDGPYELLELECGHWIVQEALEEIVGPIVRHMKGVERR